MMSRLLGGLWVIWLTLGSLPAAADTRVRVMAAPAPAVAALRAMAADIEWLPEDADEADLTLVWQADGYARGVSRHGAQPILLLAQGQGGLNLRQQDAALLWGPPLSVQLQLAREIMPGLRRAGILYRADQRAEVEALQRAATGVDILAREAGLPLEARSVAELAQRVDILIASNDEALFSRDSAKLILLTAYRHQKAWIGPTPAFVTAGALATRTVGKDSLLRAIVDRVRGWGRTHRLGGSQQLVADDVACNPQVARSLAINLSAAGCPAGRD